MNLPLTLICVMVLYLSLVHGSLTPDDSIKISVNRSLTGLSPINRCVAAGQPATMNVRLWKFTSKSSTTYVRRLVPDQFVACFADTGRILPATSFKACSEDTDKAGLKMFKFMGGVCTGYSFIITLEMQSCLGSGSNAFYINLAKASRQSVTERSPASKKEATLRLDPMSTDVIVDDDGFKGIDGKGLNSNQAYREFEVLNKCQCHYFCSSDSACNAYSVLTRNSTSARCYMANANVYTNTPSSVSGSYYAVKAVRVAPHALDNLIYKRLGTAVQGYTNHKTACEAVPGYRLVAVKYEAQMPNLLELCLGRAPADAIEDCSDSANWYYVDMIKMAGILMIQGVLPLSSTDISSYLVNQPDSTDHFIYAHSRQLHDESPFIWNSRPVCQANVYGVAW